MNVNPSVPPASQPPRAMSAGRVVLIVLGTLVALMGFGLVAGGGALTWAHTTQRDADGFFSTSAEPFSTSGYAITTSGFDAGTPGRGDWIVNSGLLGTVRVEATAPAPGRAVFVGIAHTDAVDRYLAGVERSRITGVTYRPFSAAYQNLSGGAAPAAPATQTFWEASASGTGTQRVTWDVTGGAWEIVVMNADGSRGVTVDAAAAARVPWLLQIALGLLIGGLVVLAVGVLLISLGARRPRGGAGAPVAGAWPAAVAPWGTAPPAGRGSSGPTVYPVSVTGHLDEPLSRWLWLVKWLLVIPHLVVLMFLWMALAVLTVVAFFAILLTGRYPRSIFDFNVGVMRWTWRVGFYSCSALATDRYPPFTLDSTDYPADLDVAYPEHLSRGLVLVKWWLLAIPHYIVVGLFAGGAGVAWRDQGWMWSPPGGLIGVLAIIGAVVLLFTARYPRSVLDLVVGLNRWCIRVAAYALLMRDEYPPFRLDVGPVEPQPAAQTTTPTGGGMGPAAPTPSGG